MDKRTKVGFDLLTNERYIPIKCETRQEIGPQEGIEYGVVIIPPVYGQTNEEVDGYPSDYVMYVQERLRKYVTEHGELPVYEEPQRGTHE